MDWIQLAGQARSSIREVTALLLKPTAAAMSQCSALLSQACLSLEGLQRHLAESGDRAGGAAAPLREALEELRLEIDRASTLMRQALDFQLGWARLAEAAMLTEGYTPDGSAKLSAVGGRYHLEA